MSTFVLKRLDSWSNNIQSLQQRFCTQNKAKEETRKLCCISRGSIFVSHTSCFQITLFHKINILQLFSIHLFYFFSYAFFYPQRLPTPMSQDLYPRPTTFSYTHSHAELRKDVDVKHFDFVHSVLLNIKLERTFFLLEEFQNEQLLKFNTSSPLWFPSAVFGKN